jgi:uncharacterized membrane-anchored protein YhcB (DUF1043 family)
MIMFIIGLICGAIAVIVGIFLGIDNRKQELKAIKDRLESIENDIKFDRRVNGTNLGKVIRDVIKLKEHMSRISGSRE